jgi:Na+-transporting NADH:ubiquinone oxidoreductase subunit NqrB
MGCGSKSLKSLDARLFQVVFQATLLTVGVLLRDFSLLPAQMALAIVSATATQAFWLKVFKLKNVGYLSPLITGFGLSLLLRADSQWLHPLVACLAISGKFLIRIRGKHVFNPANFGVGIALLGLPGAWVSPGQWGNDLGIAVWLIALCCFSPSS